MAKGIKLQPQASSPLGPTEKGLWLNSDNEVVVADVSGNRNLSQSIENLESGTGVENISRLYFNNTGVIILKGTPVYSPSAGLISPASGTSAVSARIVGVTAEDIPHATSGKVAILGVIPDMAGFDHGKYLYLNVTPGQLTDEEPAIPTYSPGFTVMIVGLMEGSNLILRPTLVGTL